MHPQDVAKCDRQQYVDSHHFADAVVPAKFFLEGIRLPPQIFFANSLQHVRDCLMLTRPTKGTGVSGTREHAFCPLDDQGLPPVPCFSEKCVAVQEPVLSLDTQRVGAAAIEVIVEEHCKAPRTCVGSKPPD